MPFSPPGDLPDPAVEPRYPALKVDAMLSEPPGKPNYLKGDGREVQKREDIFIPMADSC